MRRRSTVVIAVGAVLALTLGACGGTKAGPSTTQKTGGACSPTPEFNAGVGKVYNPCTNKGGTLRSANSGDWDSLDPGDTYYAYAWNFARFYSRALVTFKSAPGAEGATLTPDLAENLGVPSDGAKTWTYKIRKGVKFEDGSPVTSKDVKYAVERSLDKDTFPNGPTYFNDFLDLQGYTSPYKDTDPNKLGLKAVETPDDQTIIFHLKTAFSGFDYFAALPATAPVPAAKDTGTKYKEHVVSTGPYKFEKYDLGKSFTMVRNENWDPATDPLRKALPDRIEMALNVDAVDLDNRLLAGQLDLDVVGSGVQPATQSKILNDPEVKKHSDSAAVARLWFTVINPDVAPFDNVDCRKAIEYAVDHEAYQRAYGGATGGDIATNLMPPVVPGAKKIDLYNFESKKNGDVDSAKASLAKCGKPTGFATTITYRAERPKEKAVAESMQQALQKIGVTTTLKPFPTGDYTKLYVGKPAYAKANGLGIIIYGWGADWPDGFGFLQQIVDSRTIRASGNTNLGVKDPEIDRMIDQALQETDTKKREGIWAAIDEKVMQDAFVVPGVWSKGLVYRPANLTNVFISDGYQEIDYISLGVK